MTAETAATSAHLARAVIDYAGQKAVFTKEAIYNDAGIKILDKGAAIHDGLYDRLMAHKLTRPLEESLAVEGMVDGASIRQSIETLLAFEPFYARLVPNPQQTERLLKAIAGIPLPESVALQLSILRDVRPSLYDLALRSAWVMAWLADEPLKPLFDTSMAAAAGLLHDLGMLHLNPVLMNNKIELTREQRRELYSHPIISTVLIERQHVYTKEVVRGVMEHHEFLNGSGYPRGLQAHQISLMGQQLAMTDLVVAMMSGAHEGGELRLGVLLRMNVHRYAKLLINRALDVLDPRQDPRSDTITPLEDPIEVLETVYDTLQRWPRNVDGFVLITPERKENMAQVTRQVDQMIRNLAEAGLTPAQLDQLGDSTSDTLLSRELSLLAREAVWQLRALARQARRRWGAGNLENYPIELDTWINKTKALSLRVNGRTPESDSETGFVNSLH